MNTLSGEALMLAILFTELEEGDQEEFLKLLKVEEEKNKRR